MRLDVYLVKNNLASQEQVQEAIDYQRTHGGRLEIHLFRFGYVSESDLVTALAEQFRCPGIALSGLDISEAALGLLSSEVVLDYQVIPFHFDQSAGIVKIVCENPRQGFLRENLVRLLPNITVELYIALGTTLRLAILKHYRQSLPDQCETENDSADEMIPQSSLNLELGTEQTSPPDASEPITNKECRLLLLDVAEGDVPTLGQILQYQGYLVTVVHTTEDFVESTLRYKPHIRVIQVPGDRSTVSAILRQLTDGNHSIADHATFLIIDNPEKREIGDLLRAGFEDIIDSKNVLDLLMIKLRRTRDRISRERRRRHDILQQLGTHGSLNDMNVIDLLQAMGPTGKTSRLSVTGQGQQLTIYLNKGQITYAECDEVVGAEAVYCALGWRKGVWSLEPVTSEDIPEPNTSDSNDAILLEGCRRLDEEVHDTSTLLVDDLLSTLDQFS
ncbi:MAG: DUF4388 domain-containing protein [candidate division Zixibacteria bacterium]|nr:DUF4388 domain-containing protein [candidate division Zixibacteria bacterium]